MNIGKLKATFLMKIKSLPFVFLLGRFMSDISEKGDN